jgi:hypothetical protein
MSAKGGVDSVHTYVCFIELAVGRRGRLLLADDLELVCHFLAPAIVQLRSVLSVAEVAVWGSGVWC